MLKLTFAPIHRWVIYHKNAHKLFARSLAHRTHTHISEVDMRNECEKKVTVACRQRRFVYELLLLLNPSRPMSPMQLANLI